MQSILSDFRRHRVGMLIYCTVIALALPAAAWIPLCFSEGWASLLRYFWLAGASVVSVGCLVLLIKAFIDILVIAPKKLAEQIEALPKEERDEVLAEYPKAKTLGERWFLPRHILFYSGRKAYILHYSDIQTISADLDGLKLGTPAGEIVMPVKRGENAAILYAVLHSRNPDLRVLREETEEAEKQNS